MKYRLVVLCLVLFSIQAMTQTAPAVAPDQQAPRVAASQQGEFSTNLVQKAAGPSFTDKYCSGFISGSALPTADYVLAGWDSPEAMRFSERQYIYLKGPSLQDGSEYAIVRELRDPNHYEAFPGQYNTVRALGHAYSDIGRIKVVMHRNKVAVAMVEVSCEPIAEGDVALPVADRPNVLFRPTFPFDRFAPPNGKQTGRIIMAKDFDTILGTGMKAYLNIGADHGVQPGDYFRIVRTGEDVAKTPIDALSAKANMGEDTQAHPLNKRMADIGSQLKDFPRRNLGELIVLSVNAKSAVGMLTYAIEDVHVGDGVELEELPPPPPPAPPPAPPKPPTISCSARPTTVQPGETSIVTCQTASPDDRPVNVTFEAERGRIMPNGNSATLDTKNANPGPLRVTATATDDRNLTASANTTVSVLAPAAPPEASKAAELVFKANSAYVDNRAKALLDDLALRMQREADAHVSIVGHANTNTPAGNRLATLRANNVKTYLTKDKGVDAQRITTKSSSGSDTAEIWWIPSGAQTP